MQRLLKNIAELRKKVGQHGDEISQLLGISPDVSDPRSGCFSMIFNHLTLTLELLHYYHSIWERPRGKVSPEKRERLRQENGQRCMMALKWLFIDSLSSMEYSAKVSVAYYGGGAPAKSLIKVNRGQYVHLSNIMRNSKNLNLIHDNEYDDWQNLIFLRNCLVHNNGFSDSDKDFDIGGTRVVASAGKMMQGNLDFFAIVTEVAIERYLAWVKALIKKYGN